jgi:5-methylcytosine-specific restriction endonuclease McrA
MPYKDPEQQRAYKVRWRAANPQKVKAALVKWLAERPEQNRANSAHWQAKHPEAVSANSANYRHRKRANGGNFSRAAWEHMKAIFGYCCAYCGRRMKRLTQDHVVPVSKGGWHFSGNIVPACQSCNSRKGTKILALDKP